MAQFSSDVVIGLEIHVELSTNSKLFCACPCRPVGEGDPPNSRTCPVCLGHPGSKPVVNRAAIEYALRLALATSSKIAKEVVFSRKSYFYPDLSKNFQVSQFEIPLAQQGRIMVSGGKSVALTRIHVEEDPASLVHVGGSIHSAKYVLVDYNRSGTPLVEIVTEPVIESAEQARDFMRRLKTMLEYLGIWSADGVIKADVNVSIREGGYVRSEVKNVTGFKEIERAIEYEIRRQKQDAHEGKPFHQQTRAWNAQQGVTVLLRTKETEADYGYIIDADLVPLELTPQWVSRVEAQLPELADEKARRFVDDFGIAVSDAEVLVQDRALADLFERVGAQADPKIAARWIRREVVRVLNFVGKDIQDAPFGEKEISAVVSLLERRMISETVGQRLMEKLMDGSFDVEEYVKSEGLLMVSDASELEAWCREAVAANPQAVADVKSGNEKAINFLVGQVMRKSKGAATAQELARMIRFLIG